MSATTVEGVKAGQKFQTFESGTKIELLDRKNLEKAQQLRRILVQHYVKVIEISDDTPHGEFFVRAQNTKFNEENLEREVLNVLNLRLAAELDEETDQLLIDFY